jgi:hypothetical protein
VDVFGSFAYYKPNKKNNNKNAKGWKYKKNNLFKLSWKWSSNVKSWFLTRC